MITYGYPQLELVAGVAIVATTYRWGNQRRDRNRTLKLKRRYIAMQGK
jgi:hypothetical protein